MPARPVLDAGSVTHLLLDSSSPYSNQINVTIDDTKPNRYLFVFVADYDQVARNGSMTYDNITVPILSSIAENGYRPSIWGLQYPPGGGAKSLSLNVTGPLFGYLTTASFYNVGSYAGGSAKAGSSSPANCDVVTQSDSVAIAQMTYEGGTCSTLTAGQTLIQRQQGDTHGDLSEYFNGDGTTKNMTVTESTSRSWRMIGGNLTGRDPAIAKVIMFFENFRKECLKKKGIYDELMQKGGVPIGQSGLLGI